VLLGDGANHRFCFSCGKMHPLECFDGKHRCARVTRSPGVVPPHRATARLTLPLTRRLPLSAITTPAAGTAVPRC
jgi:hypothetical protein